MSVTAAKGWLAAGVKAGTKPSGALDLALVCSEQPATVAGAFTTNQVLGAPIVVSKPKVASGAARGVVVSAGIANVATGEEGWRDADRMAAAAAEACGIPSSEMLVSSTGIIGRRIPIGVVTPAIKQAAAALSVDGGEAAAHAIMTTDVGPKTAVARFEVDGVTVTVGGMAKGAGMIAPAMELHATLLVFVTTDGAATADQLRAALGTHLERSFNSISVDQCMSTSDTVLLFANGATGVEVGERPEFIEAVGAVLHDLAYQVVRDGEGATTVIRVKVVGAADDAQARACAKEVATSLLVRCAVAGADPNWGRIAQAIGQTPGLQLDPSKIDVAIAGVAVAGAGMLLGSEPEAAKAMAEAKKQGEVVIEIDLHAGMASWEYLSSDLTTEYVRFNAEYTT